MKPGEMRDVLLDKCAWITVRIENREGSEGARQTQARERHAIVELLRLCGKWDEDRYQSFLDDARRKRGIRGHIRVEVITQHRSTTRPKDPEP